MNKKSEDRGMLKWQPFYSVLSEKEIKENTEKKYIEEMPILSEDQINENEEIIKNAYNCHLEIIATIYVKKSFENICGYITKINPNEKTIYINNKPYSFNHIYKIKEKN